MNERIKELAEQAEQYALDKANEGDDEDYDYSFDDDFQQKFAELLIKECTTKMALEIMNNSWIDDAVKNTHEHFGVE